MAEGRPKSTHHSFKGSKAKFQNSDSAAPRETLGHERTARRFLQAVGISKASGGGREAERRRAQIEAGQLKAENGLSDDPA